MAIKAEFRLDDLPHKIKMLWWQEQGLQYTRTGYGSKIPTRHMVKLPGSNRWRRVYCCCWSNAGTCYVPDKNGDWTIIY